MDETTGSAQQDETVRDQQLASSEETQSAKNEKVPSYDWHRRVLADSKKMKSQLQEANERLALYEQREMETQGKHQELISSLRDENNRLKGEVKQRDEVYTWSQVTNELKSAALKLGCSKPDHLLRLLPEDALSQISVDDNYRADKDEVMRVVESMKANPEYSYFFKANAPSVDTVNPVTTIEKDKPKTAADMTLGEKLKFLNLRGDNKE